MKFKPQQSTVSMMTGKALVRDQHGRFLSKARIAALNEPTPIFDAVLADHSLTI